MSKWRKSPERSGSHFLHSLIPSFPHFLPPHHSTTPFLRVQLIPRRRGKQAADEAEDAAHEELAEDEAEEEGQEVAVEAHAAQTEDSGLGDPAEEDAEPHPVHRAAGEADRVADRVE